MSAAHQTPAHQTPAPRRRAKGLWPILLGEMRAPMLLAVAAGVVSGAGSAALLAVLNTSLRSEGPLAGPLLGAFGGLCLLVSGGRLTSAYFLERLGSGAVKELRLRLARQVLATPLRQLESLGPARMLAVLGDDIAVISGAIALMPVLAINGAIVVGCLVYLVWLSPQLFGAFLALLAVGVFTYRLASMAGLARLHLVRRLQERLYAQLRAVAEGHKELQLHDERRQAFLGRIEETTSEQRRLQLSSRMLFAAAGAWGHLLFFLVIGGLLLLRPYLAGVDAAQFISYVVVLLYLMAPLQMFLDSAPQLARARVSVERMEELALSLQAEKRGVPDLPRAAAWQPWREIRLEGVVHRYRGESAEETFVLGPLDLALARGEILMIAGGNGSGKTTLAKLLVGLYEPEGGAVLLDGRPVTDANREDYRRHFSAVFSDFFLFEELLGLPREGLEARAEGYLRQLKLEGKVSIRDAQLSTTALSQGQRKRLALLTAYLEDRPVYLFDEWAADQDPYFKSVFYQALLPELKARGKTVVVISHDEAYYGIADRLIRLDYGQIVPASAAEALAVGAHA